MVWSVMTESLESCGAFKIGKLPHRCFGKYLLLRKLMFCHILYGNIKRQYTGVLVNASYSADVILFEAEKVLMHKKQ